MLRGTDVTVPIAGVELVAAVEGAFVWPAERLLVVADLHLEKGSSYASRRVFLPPYDTAATLARLARLVQRFAPRRLVFLGDTFHDRRASARVLPRDRESLAHILHRREAVFITGNHDPEPPEGIEGLCLDALSVGALTFRHEPSPGDAPGEIAGHLHPVAKVAARGGRCAAAASPATGGAPSCPPSAPTPAASTCATRRSRRCSRGGSSPM